MRQLRLVGLGEDGASLLLESPTGESYRLPIDERVRAACRGDLTRLGQIEIEMDNPLRPREIQSRVRAGESAEQIAASSGMPLDRVLRFAYAVLQERGRVVAQARGAAARPKAPDTLGDLVEDRLTSRGTDAATLEWDAWRRDDGRWSVKLAWRHGDREHAAHWSLDLAQRVLLPEDPAAEQLTAADYHARTITAVTPLAVAARAAEPGRPREQTRSTDLGRPREQTRSADPGRSPEQTRPAEQSGPAEQSRPAGPRRAPERTGPADPGPAPDPSRPAELHRLPEPAREAAPARGAERAVDPDREPRRVVERRPGEPSRRAHRGEAPPDGQRPNGPDFDEIRAGGRRPGSDHRADAPQAPARRTNPVRDGQPGRRTDPAARLRDAQTASGRRADPAGQMRDARARPTRPDSPREPRAAQDAEDPPADEVRQVAAGGGTIPLVDVESEDDRARRATVPSWDDILLGVRRHH